VGIVGEEMRGRGKWLDIAKESFFRSVHSDRVRRGPRGGCRKERKEVPGKGVVGRGGMSLPGSILGKPFRQRGAPGRGKRSGVKRSG